MDYEILIAGGGPAGLSTWLHLNALAPELASRAVVIEKATYPRDKLCAGGITRLGVLVLGGLGLDLGCSAVPIHRIEFRLSEQAYAIDQPNVLRVVRRHAFDHALATAAVARGLELHQNEAFVGLSREGTALRVRTTTREYIVRIVVGADGVHSAVRHAIGLADSSRISRLIEVITPAHPQRDPEFDAATAIFDFTAIIDGVQGYVWHCPCLDAAGPAMNRGIFDSRVHPGRERADLIRVFATALRQCQVDAPTTIWKSHPIRWFSPEGTFAAANVLLVGDAAGVDAFLGEGISPSLDYGDFAANMIRDAFSSGQFDFADASERLLRHPVGQTLMARRRLAAVAYAPGGLAVTNLSAVLHQWFGAA